MQGIKEGWPLSLPFHAGSYKESHHLSANETSMLKGGDSCANKFHYIQLSDATRGAIWVLEGVEMEAEKREGYASLLFGRVQYFLQYSSGHSEHYIAVVDWFGNPQLDTNTRLWFVPSSEAAERSVIEIANLSRPLATCGWWWQTVVFKLFCVIMLLNNITNSRNR